MQRMLAAIGAAGLAFILLIVSAMSPWWTAHLRGSSGTFAIDQQGSARPFDPGRIGDQRVIDLSDALLAGLLLLAAILVAATGLALLLWAWARGAQAPSVTRLAPWILVGAAAVALAVPLIALVTWPNDDASFWDSDSAGGFTASTFPEFGWYVALASAVGLIVAGLMAWRAPPPSVAPVQYAARVR